MNARETANRTLEATPASAEFEYRAAGNIASALTVVAAAFFALVMTFSMKGRRALAFVSVVSMRPCLMREAPMLESIALRCSRVTPREAWCLL